MAQFFLFAQDKNKPRWGEGDRLTLTPEQSHYLCRVLRHKTGDKLVCGNGCGDLYHCHLDRADTKCAAISIGALKASQPPHQPGIAVGISVLKGTAMDRAIQQAVELGAGDIYLVAAQRSNATPDDNRLVNKLSHWKKVIQGSAEQCGQTRLPRLYAPTPLSGLTFEGAVLLFDLEGEEFADYIRKSPGLSGHYLLLIGPEGGWSADELYLAQTKGFHRIKLPGFTLRAETVPSVAVTYLNCQLNRLE